MQAVSLNSRGNPFLLGIAGYGRTMAASEENNLLSAIETQLNLQTRCTTILRSSRNSELYAKKVHVIIRRIFKSGRRKRALHFILLRLAIGTQRAVLSSITTSLRIFQNHEGLESLGKNRLRQTNSSLLDCKSGRQEYLTRFRSNGRGIL
ncbi:hypothetical protein P152DRAFT_949 [Eremomyces bilateralis CBS 781.70]|uniref:Uncharacterized protein n=1 Tax=Eremomyces bilateralis CBS 781.70 TaxID=1392243 RepID=A0A6G1GFJ1_9PEZI|nr:uncharacterized protein P152DRAFT_949 [Eremomyces bilateralis CBS 781.70]KAF1816794.1 hypothetical protein P152DRAFT_949 [Eremomyces bilateralis CBS 781.70]